MKIGIKHIMAGIMIVILIVLVVLSQSKNSKGGGTIAEFPTLIASMRNMTR